MTADNNNNGVIIKTSALTKTYRGMEKATVDIYLDFCFIYGLLSKIENTIYNDFIAKLFPDK